MVDDEGEWWFKPVSSACANAYETVGRAVALSSDGHTRASAAPDGTIELESW